MARSRIALSRFAAPPSARRPWRPTWRLASINWGLLIAIIILTLAYDFLQHLTGQAVFFVTVPVLLYLGMNLIARPNRPIHLTFFDVVTFCLWFYLLAGLVVKSTTGDPTFDSILRSTRFIAVTAIFYVVISFGRTSEHDYSRMMHFMSYVLIGTCLFAGLQIVGQQTGLFDLFLEYSRTRTYLSVWQATAYFAEPAFFGQFLVAGLFIFFLRMRSVVRHWLAFGIVVVAILLTKSVGTLFGLLIWSIAVVLYNLNEVLSLRYVYAKVLVIGLIALGLLSFVAVSRLSLMDVATLEGLDSSGEQRVIGELRALQYVLDQHGIGGLLFGLYEGEAETVRSAVGFSESVSGNALIEVTLRYGIVVPVLLLVQFCAAVGMMSGLLLFGIFALLGQIDGAVAKPFIWLYVALVAVSLSYRRWQRVPTAAGPAAPLCLPDNMVTGGERSGGAFRTRGDAAAYEGRHTSSRSNGSLGIARSKAPSRRQNHGG